MKSSVTKLGSVSIAKVDLFRWKIRREIYKCCRSDFYCQTHVWNDKVMMFKRSEIKMKVWIVQRNKRDQIHFSWNNWFIADINRYFVSERSVFWDMSKINHWWIESKDAFFCLDLNWNYESSLKIGLFFSY